MRLNLPSQNKITSKRLLIVFVGICVLFFILIAKLYTLQIVQGDNGTT